MKRKLIAASVAFVAVIACATMFALSASETAVHDGSGNMAAWSILGVKSATPTETINLHVNSSHELLSNIGGASATVSIARIDDYDNANYKVTGNSASGVNLNPAWSANSFFHCNKAATSSVFVVLDGTAANDTGFEIDAGDCWAWAGLTFSTFSVYVDGGADATQTVKFGRVTP